MSAEKVIKLLAPDLTELLDLHPAQARQLQKNGLVEKIPSNSELILRLKNRAENSCWESPYSPEDLLKLINERLQQSTVKDESIEVPQGFAGLHGDLLSNMFGEVEKHDEMVVACIFKAKEYSEIRKFGRDILNLITLPSIYKTGVLSFLWGAAMVVRREFPPLDQRAIIMIGEKRKITFWSDAPNLRKFPSSTTNIQVRIEGNLDQEVLENLTHEADEIHP